MWAAVACLVALLLGGSVAHIQLLSAAEQRALKSLVNPFTGEPTFPPRATDIDCTQPNTNGLMWYSLSLGIAMHCAEGVQDRRKPSRSVTSGL